MMWFGMLVRMLFWWIIEKDGCKGLIISKTCPAGEK